MKPRISAIDTWVRHEKCVLEVLELALALLQKEQSLPGAEDKINRKLYFHIRRANRKLLDRGGGIPFPIFYEARNQPMDEDVEEAEREHKRPDFQWGLVNMQERDKDRGDMFFVIECKRLGTPNNPNWVFNQKYVANGILRFRNPGHGYGKGTPSGAMIGYVQSMDLALILKEVNGYCLGNNIAEIELLDDDWQEKALTRLHNEFARAFDITPFKICHLWIDLR